MRLAAIGKLRDLNRGDGDVTAWQENRWRDL
jgi:hypothetical protein